MEEEEEEEEEEGLPNFPFPKWPCVCLQALQKKKREKSVFLRLKAPLPHLRFKKGG